MSLFTAVRDTYTGFKSLIIGLGITGREAAKPIITVPYPRETLPMPARFRGHIKLVLDPETGRPRCTACTLCAKACPSGCIELDGVKREGDKKKSVSKYDLDFTKCSLCGSCVEICPSDAIEFSKEYNVVSLNRSQFDQMDLYQKVEKEAAEWVKAHPQPLATPDAAPAVPAPTSNNTAPTAGPTASAPSTANASASAAAVAHRPTEKTTS